MGTPWSELEMCEAASQNACRLTLGRSTVQHRPITKEQSAELTQKMGLRHRIALYHKKSPQADGMLDAVRLQVDESLRPTAKTGREAPLRLQQNPLGGLPDSSSLSRK